MKHSELSRTFNKPLDRWLRRGALTALAGTFLVCSTNAQLTGYTFSTSVESGALYTMTGGATTIFGPGGADEQASTAQGIGFDFYYDGGTYSQFYVNTDGGLRLDAAIGGSATGSLTSATNQGRIMPFSGQQHLETGGTVRTELVGTAPNRIRVIQWFTRVNFSPVGPATNTYQVWLYEGTNVIQFRYGAGVNSSAQIRTAIRSVGTTDFLNVQTDHTIGATVNNSGIWPGEDRVYTFTAPDPCTGDPDPGNATAVVTSVCPGNGTTVSIDQILEGFISYQWESSPNGIDTWGPIGGATSHTYNTGSLSSTTWFRCVVTCSNGGGSETSGAVQVVVAGPAPTYYVYDGVTEFSETFDGTWLDRCATRDIPSIHWTNSPANGNTSWRRGDDGQTSGAWSNALGGSGWGTSANPGLNMPTGTQGARFHHRGAGTAAESSKLDLHLNMSAGNGAEDLRFRFYQNANAANTRNFKILQSTDGGATFPVTLYDTTGVTLWSNRAAIITSQSPTTVIRFEFGQTPPPGPFNNGNDPGIDNIRIVPPPACVAPAGVTAVPNGAGSVQVSWTCDGCTGPYFLEYGASGFTPGTGTTVGPFAGSPQTISSLSNGNYHVYALQDCDGTPSAPTGPVAFNIVAGDFCDSAIDLEGLIPAGGSLDAIQVTNAGASNQFNSASCAASTPGADKVYYHDVEPGDTFGFVAQGLFAQSVMSLSYGGTCPGDNSIACKVGTGYFPGGSDVVPITWTNTTCTTQRVYFVIDANTVSTGNVALWGYTYTPAAASCQVVTGLAAQVTSLSEATISWDATCSGDVIVEYGPAGFTPGTGATANGGTAVPMSGTTTSLTGLSTGVPYDVYVRQDCGNDDFSANSTVLSFTITPGENCAVAIDLANEFAPLIASTAGATNDTPTLSCGAAGGGDLVYFISVPDGATINFDAIHDYPAVVQVSYGSSCPGTVLTCAAGLALYSWENTTGEAQNVYWIQDGTGSGDFLLNWLLDDPCAIGTPCDDGNPATINDVIIGGCVCAGTSITAVTLELRTEGTSNFIAWEIVDANNVPVCTGGGYGPNDSPITEFCNLPDGCYRLRVEDESGDGLGLGAGYQLRLDIPDSPPNDIRIVDNLGNFTTGEESAIGSGPSAICFPMASGPDAPKPLFHLRDKLDFVSGKYLVCEEDSDVSAEWGGPNMSNSGYQFWLFDPIGSYSYRRFRNHATSDGFANVGATRACHMKINNWAVAQQAPPYVLLNVRIRTRVNGVNGNWGPAYRFMIDPERAACPLTKLNDFPGNQFESCNQTRVWGGGGNFIHARPVSSANQYQWRFRRTAENFELIRTSSTYFITLNWTDDAPLAAGTYEVDVRARRNGVWCAPAEAEEWGAICNLTILSSQAQGGGENFALENMNANLSMYPNPNQGDQVWLSIDAVDEGVQTINVDFFDLAGHRAVARVIPTQGDRLHTVLDLQGELAAGVYIVHIMAGEKVYTERLVVAY